MSNDPHVQVPRTVAGPCERIDVARSAQLMVKWCVTMQDLVRDVLGISTTRVICDTSHLKRLKILCRSELLSPHILTHKKTKVSQCVHSSTYFAFGH
eukprot:5008990-Amphidinium_carterae.1